jgi:hypothetical protein
MQAHPSDAVRNFVNRLQPLRALSYFDCKTRKLHDGRTEDFIPNLVSKLQRIFRPSSGERTTEKRVLVQVVGISPHAAQTIPQVS